MVSSFPSYFCDEGHQQQNCIPISISREVPPYPADTSPPYGSYSSDESIESDARNCHPYDGNEPMLVLQDTQKCYESDLQQQLTFEIPCTIQNKSFLNHTSPFEHQIQEEKQRPEDKEKVRIDRWKKCVGPGLTELLYPFDKCTIIETDDKLRILSCKSNNGNSVKNELFFGYHPSFLRNKTIDVLLTPKCKSRIFGGVESISYNEIIRFCGDVVRFLFPFLFFFFFL